MKKGFVVYFDNCRLLEAMSDRAYAAVWRTVTEYARRVATDEEAEDWLAQRLALLPADAAMAARFMADNVRRDDIAYCQRIEQRRLRAAQYRTNYGQEAESKRNELASYVAQLHRESGPETHRAVGEGLPE